MKYFFTTHKNLHLNEKIELNDFKKILICESKNEITGFDHISIHKKYDDIRDYYLTIADFIKDDDECIFATSDFNFVNLGDNDFAGVSRSHLDFIEIVGSAKNIYSRHDCYKLLVDKIKVPIDTKFMYGNADFWHRFNAFQCYFNNIEYLEHQFYYDHLILNLFLAINSSLKTRIENE